MVNEEYLFAGIRSLRAPTGNLLSQFRWFDFQFDLVNIGSLQGNQLSSTVPSLEYYLNDLDQRFLIEKNLGYSKFLKSLLCVPSADSPLSITKLLDADKVQPTNIADSGGCM
jgi:hypothetical protein